MRVIALNNYDNLLNSGRWSTKYPKDAQIVAIAGVAQKLAYDSNKSSEKSNTSNRETTKGDPAYTRDLSPWTMKETNGGVKKNKDRKEYWWLKKHRTGKGQ